MSGEIFFVHFKCKLCWDRNTISYKDAENGNYKLLGISDNKWVHLLPEHEFDMKKMISIPKDQIILKERRI
ncbi:MAG: hypothetical protein ACFFDF_08015 [Candidatus Odinarchaeota archaeon]